MNSRLIKSTNDGLIFQTSDGVWHLVRKPHDKDFSDAFDSGGIKLAISWVKKSKKSRILGYRTKFGWSKVKEKYQMPDD